MENSFDASTYQSAEHTAGDLPQADHTVGENAAGGNSHDVDAGTFQAGADDPRQQRQDEYSQWALQRKDPLEANLAAILAGSMSVERGLQDWAKELVDSRDPAALEILSLYFKSNKQVQSYVNLEIKLQQEKAALAEAADTLAKREASEEVGI